MTEETKEQARREEATPSREELLDAIANMWGGVGCFRQWDDAAGVYRFGQPDDYNYIVTPPETRTMYFEDDGRPFSGVTPADVYTVRAIGAAPDDWFTVDLQGNHTNWRGVTTNIMPATHHGPWCDEEEARCLRCPSCREEPIETVVTIPGFVTVKFQGGGVNDIFFTPSAADAGYRGDIAYRFSGDSGVDPTDLDGEFWQAVRTRLEAFPTIGWVE